MSMDKVFALVPSQYHSGQGADLDSGYTRSLPSVFTTARSLMGFPFSSAKIAPQLVSGRCSPSGPIGSRILDYVQAC
jgi:hypothetical protein